MGKSTRKWLSILLPAGGLGVLLWALRVRRSQVQTSPLLIVQNNGHAEEPGILEVGQTLADILWVDPILVGSPEAIFDALDVPRKRSPIVFVGAGPSSWLQGIGIEEMADLLLPLLAPGFIVSINACRAGANVDEPNWVNPYESGGERSVAAKLRDALVDIGSPIGEIRANHSTGIRGNPSGRVFYVSPQSKGTPGVALREIMDAPLEGWGNEVRGPLALQWIAGGGFEV